MLDTKRTSMLLGAALFSCTDQDTVFTNPPSGDAGDTPAITDRVTRGQYLVDHVSACADCHTPRGPMGAPLEDQYLAGSECFVRLDNGSCLHTSNLTAHETGLLQRTDLEIKRMIRDGVRPGPTGDEPLYPVMPSFVFHNLSDADLDAVVAYLRTVPGVEHDVPARGPEFDPGPDNSLAASGLPATRQGGRRGALGPATPLPLSAIPEPMPGYPEADAARRGRYLASQAGACIVCHSRHVDPELPWLDYAGLFAGGEEFEVGLPTIPYAGNITSDDETGIGGWSVQDVVTAIRQGTDREGDGICPPMPAGAMAAFGGLTDQDALDIAHYIKSLPPVVDATERACPFPPVATASPTPG
jgi:mono/diheme cytochrome c family protein